MIHKSLSFILTALLAIGLVACGGGDGGNGAAQEQEGETATESAGVKEVVIQPVDNQLKFATEEFTVRPGQEVRLVMDNIATGPASAFSHNVVILSTSDAIDRVGQAGAQAGPENDYLPEDDAILFYTPMADPGEQTEVTFTAPSDPGDFPYICTFPGHYVTMQGTMIVEGEPV